MVRVSSKEQLRRFLRERVGDILTSDQLYHASGGAVEWARRVREIRQDEGWNIQTHKDSAVLKPGQYCLVEEPPEPGTYVTLSRRMSGALRARILERNGFTCQSCGAAAGDLDERGQTVRLQIGHIQDQSHGGEESEGNLFAQCTRCNEGAKNLTAEPPSWTWLLTQIRRARRDDQLQALAWLKGKYEKGTLFS